MKPWMIFILSMTAICAAALLLRYQIHPVVAGTDIYIIRLDRFTGYTSINPYFP